MSISSPVLVKCLAVVLSATALAGVSPASAEETRQPEAAAPTAPAPGRVGVIDVGRLVETSETGRAGLAQIQALQAEKKVQFDALTAEGEALEARVREGELTLVEDQMAALRRQLEDKKLEISRFGVDSQREIDKAQRDMLAEIQEKVFPIINEVGREGGFSLIFRKFESGLIFTAEGVDITDRVIARLDSANSSS